MADAPIEPAVEEPLGDAPLDTAAVTFLPTYRVGYLPPEPGSLAAGELYIELTPPDAPGVPAMWLGLPDYLGVEGGQAKLVSVPAGPARTSAPRVEPREKK